MQMVVRDEAHLPDEVGSTCASDWASLNLTPLSIQGGYSACLPCLIVAIIELM